PCGFPRFKTPTRWHSIQRRQYATHREVWLDEDGKHVPVPATLGRLLKITLHRSLEGDAGDGSSGLARRWALVRADGLPDAGSRCRWPDAPHPEGVRAVRASGSWPGRGLEGVSGGL